ncbi:MAG: Sec-independent protein translocase subunit TatC, sec-independent protein translocase protein TatC [Candidatus Saccharibacteria bacterium]|nr:Sec-independent protein translocase subunit TatC, sec-independent protein translocase protein TatC [Candidatus Saccharibacteria bacterium]
MADKHNSLPQTLGEHVDELRSRLKWFALFFVVGASVGYAFHTRFIEILKGPLHEKLYYTSPAGGFNFVMKVSLVFGLVLALPALVYNVIDFIRPAFSKEIKKSTVRRVSLLSLLLALSGGTFAFLVVVPGSLKFFLKFSDGAQPLLSATDYFSFVINCVISFMVIFQAPLIILFIDKIKPLTPRQLLGYERYVIVGSLAAALILPFTYDPMTQFLIALPIIALYNLSIILIAITHARRKRALRRAHQTSRTFKPMAAPQTGPSAPQIPARKAPALQPMAAAATVAARTQAKQPVYRQRQVMDIMPRQRPVNQQPYMGGNISATPDLG